MNAAMALRLAPAGAVLDVMQRLIADPNSRVRLIAAGSLLTAESGNNQAGVVLLEALEDPALRVREAAIELLASLGTECAAFIEGLRGRDGPPAGPGMAPSSGEPLQTPASHGT